MGSDTWFFWKRIVSLLFEVSLQNISHLWPHHFRGKLQNTGLHVCPSIKQQREFYDLTRDLGLFILSRPHRQAMSIEDLFKYCTQMGIQFALNDNG